MHHRTLCLTYHTMFDEMPPLKTFKEYVNAAPSLHPKQGTMRKTLGRSKETPCSASSPSSLAHADKPLLGTLTRLAVPDDHKETQMDRVLSSLLVRAMRFGVRYQDPKRTCQSDGASFRVHIGPECPSSPFRRPKKKPAKSNCTTLTPTTQPPTLFSKNVHVATPRPRSVSSSACTGHAVVGTWLRNRGAVTVQCQAEEEKKRQARHPQTNLEKFSLLQMSSEQHHCQTCLYRIRCCGLISFFLARLDT